MLEVRDAASGALIAERELDQYLTGFTNRGSVMMFELDADDQPTHTLIKPTLRRADSTKSGG